MARDFHGTRLRSVLAQCNFEPARNMKINARTAVSDTEKNKVAPDEAIPAAEIPADVKRDRISGVFSTQSVDKIGTGTTVRKTILKTYWFAEEGPTDPEKGRTILVQPLNKNNIPSGPKDEVPLGDFLEKFSPELEFYQKEVFPKLKELDATLKRAEEQREQGALYSAQFEYESALNVDEENVRANFGLGLTYMERGDTTKANDIFQRVVSLDAAFAPDHKHLFNEFGINLRKSRLLDQAVDYYARALELVENDENLHYNVARAYYEKGEMALCREHLAKALEMNPNFEEAQQFLAYLDKQAEEQ